MMDRLLRLIYPPKCIFCQELLAESQTDLCHSCRENEPTFTKLKFKPTFVARWTGVWYYKDNVRNSILRYKFSNRRSYARFYAQMLAMRLQKENMDNYDILTWVPVAPMRKFRRGYDQVELIARAIGKETGSVPVRTLKKIRNTPPQSGIPNASHRRANVLGAYRAVNISRFAGKRVLLLDDVLTTGATASECARVLLTAGAKEVNLAVLAVASHNEATKSASERKQ